MQRQQDKEIEVNNKLQLKMLELHTSTTHKGSCPHVNLVMCKPLQECP